MTAHVALRIEEQSQVGEARRLASALAEALGFDEEDRGRVSIAVTEAARNLLLHGGGGEILLRAFSDDHVVEVMALDRGRGMENVQRCLEDGYSTAGTPGTGLGAITRMADRFDIHSAPGIGTALLAHFAKERRRIAPTAGPFQCGAVCVPKRGEEVSGDSWFAGGLDSAGIFAVIDGLGHGAFAAEASKEAVAALRERTSRDPVESVEEMHGRLRATRGAAAAVTVIEPAAQQVRYAGVGNIAGVVLTRAGQRSMVSHNGTLGHQVRKVQEFTYPWPGGALLVMHSDGLESRWSLDRYPGILARHPSLVAGVLYRDHTRGRDDVTVLVARDTAPEDAP